MFFPQNDHLSILRSLKYMFYKCTEDDNANGATIPGCSRTKLLTIEVSCRSAIEQKPFGEKNEMLTSLFLNIPWDGTNPILQGFADKILIFL